MNAKKYLLLWAAHYLGVVHTYININSRVIYRIYRALVCLAYFLNKFIY